MTTTSELRDRLMEQKTLYQQSVLQAQQEQKKIQSIISRFTDEQSQLIQESIGVSLDTVKSFDLERMKTDAEYLSTSSEVLKDIIQKLHDYLEEALSV